VSITDLDARHVWHPYAPMDDPHRPHVVESASGATLHLADGRELLDGMSSWWAAVHGYRHPRLDEALQKQLESMAHVMFGGLTHEPAVALVERLVDLTPSGLDHVFLADSGSVSVEVALKMALQYQRGRGQAHRTRMLTIRGGYHGDTFGAMSVSDPVGGMHEMFRHALPSASFLLARLLDSTLIGPPGARRQARSSMKSRLTWRQSSSNRSSRARVGCTCTRRPSLPGSASRPTSTVGS
jgi:adenosylmethionine-8-amino-7-oxononanoate aminotransferase